MDLKEKIGRLSIKKRLILSEKLIELERHQSKMLSVPSASILVAYVVAANKLPISEKELRAKLKSNLPDYMLPHSYVFLNKLPMLSNGKLDTKALENIENHNVQLKHKIVKARNLIEEKLVEIWKQVLVIDNVSVEDDFFDIGGDSILSIQIIARARN